MEFGYYFQGEQKKHKNQRINKNNKASQKSVDRDYIYSSPPVPNDARIV
jgi:hypothetical protein